MKQPLVKSAPEAKFGWPDPPTLLVRMEPWHTAFVGNLGDYFRPRKVAAEANLAPFWPDVFVASYLPWRRFTESVIGHVAAVAMVWSLAQLWEERPHVAEAPAFHSSDVIYYQPAEYLPPLNTGGPQPQARQGGDPAYAPQPILSVPPEADNRRQTIVTAPDVKLQQDVPLPNIVAWDRTQPTVPIAATNSASRTKLPEVQAAVVAPAPEVNSRLRAVAQTPDAVVAPAPQLDVVKSRSTLQTPEASVIAPPPSVENINTRKLGDINIAHANVVAPAPLLPLGEQRASMRAVQTTGSSGAAVVPPPPSVGQMGPSSGGRVIALNVHPLAAGGPPDVPAGNRRGSFAATPEGKPGASGAPGTAGGPGNQGGGANPNEAAGAGNATEGKNANGLPPGLFVGASKTGNAAAVSGGGQAAGTGQFGAALMAKAMPPRVSPAPRNFGSEPSVPTSEVERKVFGDSKIYALTLNTPNLNSAGGSWVMHFADFEPSKPGELAAPVAIQEVDPGYPIELMRKNVQGTVMLSAVIFPDGTVGGVHVLRGLDDTLDQYACNALAKWKFQPATKNGNPVAVQTVVVIPFRPMRTKGF